MNYIEIDKEIALNFTKEICDLCFEEDIEVFYSISKYNKYSPGLGMFVFWYDSYWSCRIKQNGIYFTENIGMVVLKKAFEEMLDKELDIKDLYLLSILHELGHVDYKIHADEDEKSNADEKLMKLMAKKHNMNLKIKRIADEEKRNRLSRQKVYKLNLEYRQLPEERYADEFAVDIYKKYSAIMELYKSIMFFGDITPRLENINYLEG